tara:strand:+ start:3286 stop:3465 length:180 start_codon:yes stop_codon:yes gene_type:complete
VVNLLYLQAKYFSNHIQNTMSEYQNSDSFADFIDELETSEKNQNAQCSIDHPECESCSG